MPMSGARAVAGTAEVVDHDAGALAGEGQGVLTPEPTTGSGDDDDAILHSGHGVPFVETMIGGRARTQKSLRASFHAFSVYGG